MREEEFISKLKEFGFKTGKSTHQLSKAVGSMLIAVSRIDESKWGVIKHLFIEHLSERTFYDGFKSFEEVLDIVMELESTYLNLKEN